MTNLEKYVRITYGIHDLRAEVGGLSVAEVKLIYQDILNMRVDAEPYVNGVMSKETTILMPDDRCEFMKTWGRKGKEFWPKTEIMALTGISEWRWGRLVEKGMKVVLIDGVEVVAEAEFRKFCQRMINTDDKIKIAAKLGRPDTTADIAEFANSRRPIMSWKEIYNEWSDANPDDRRVKNWKHLRDTWSRHYRKKPYQKKAGELF